MDKNLLVEGESVFVENLTAPNILYGVKAGTGISITNQESQIPTISVAGIVSSLQGQKGDVELQAGSDIGIDGTLISNISTLATVVARGDCENCIEDNAVTDSLTIDGSGNIAAML